MLINGGSVIPNVLPIIDHMIKLSCVLWIVKPFEYGLNFERKKSLTLPHKFFYIL